MQNVELKNQTVKRKVQQILQFIREVHFFLFLVFSTNQRRGKESISHIYT